MDLYEYQARQMFKEHGVPVLDYRLASTPEEAREGARELLADGASLLVVKAQVKTGGRGKAGGVKLAHTADEAYEKAEAILGLDIKGHIVKKVMIASGADIAAEYYFSILLDRSNRRHLAMCSREGGMDIETLAKERPEALARVPLDPTVGIDAEVARHIAKEAGFDEETAETIAPVLETLWTVYRDEDATLVEVNPLVSSPDGSVWAVDGKVTLDDNARFRHPGHAELVDVAAQDPREAAAKAAGLNYVRLEGQVGIIGNGAGLVMSTLDVVAMAGEEFGGMKPANFLDIGGGASAEVMAKGLATSRFAPCLSTSSVASPPATRSPEASSVRSRRWATRPRSRLSCALTATRSRRAARFSPRLRTRSSTWKKQWTARPGVQLSSQPRPRRSNDPRIAGEHHDYLRQF